MSQYLKILKVDIYRMSRFACLSTKTLQYPFSNEKSLINKTLILNKNHLILCNQRNYNLSLQNSRNITKDFKRTSRKSSKDFKKPEKPIELFKPIKVMPNFTSEENEPNLGEELGGKLEKYQINSVLNSFRENSIVLSLATEKGINAKMFGEAIISFRQFCLDSKTLPVDLHIKICDIAKDSANETDLFPYFLQHTNLMYPHLKCMDDLKQLSDLTEPTNWYTKAREMKRKIIYHAGPTNSGKTFTALQAFQNSKSGVYCGPLKLLASEVYNKSNKLNTKCDLITGEERKYANQDNTPSEHVSCTVEMVNLDKDYETAVIDEIQMISDLQRGWAWTRAFLGIAAKEIHVCGDMTALNIISDLAFLCGDSFEVRNYKRLTQLNTMNNALESFDAIAPGDCIVCFNKNDIFNVTNILEKKGHQIAVIYGSMPPGVKMAQAERFNNPQDKCKILVATDAVGMGLNLSIKRIIFYSIKKPQTKDDQDDKRRGESSIEYITTSQALQIAGRAGRFNTSYADGFVTTFYKQDLPILKEILKKPLEKTSRAGLHPTAEQIELFAYQLPNHSLSSLIQIFMSICKIDNGQYFMCNFEEIKNLAQLIDHIPIPIRAKYTFAISPINARNPFITSCFVKFVRSYSNDDPITIEFLKSIINWPLKMPSNLNELIHLENVFDVLDLYLWLSFRFPVIFFQTSEVIQLRQELEQIIYSGVKKLLSKEKGNKRLQINKNISFSSSLNSQKEIINVLKINEIDEINKVQAEKYLNTDYKDLPKENETNSILQNKKVQFSYEDIKEILKDLTKEDADAVIDKLGTANQKKIAQLNKSEIDLGENFVSKLPENLDKAPDNIVTNVNNLLNRMKFSKLIQVEASDFNLEKNLKSNSEPDKANVVKFKYDELKDFLKDNIKKEDEFQKSRRKKKFINMDDLSVQKLQKKIQNKLKNESANDKKTKEK